MQVRILPRQHERPHPRPVVRGGPRRRRGHPHAVRAAQAAAPAVRPADADVRARLPGRHRRATGSSSWSATRASGSPRSCRSTPTTWSSTSSSSGCSAAPVTPPWSASSASPTTDDEGDVLVLPGDTPLLRPATIAGLVAQHRAPVPPPRCSPRGMDDPTGYGRVVRGRTTGSRRIVEHADATDEELAIDEINTSIYCFRRSLLAPALRRLEPGQRPGRVLPDRRGRGAVHDAGYPVESVVADDPAETQGVNDRVQLAAAEAELRRRTNEALLRSGRHHARPRARFVDTTVHGGPRRHAVPRRDPAGRHRGRRRHRDRARHPAGRLRGGRGLRGRADHGPLDAAIGDRRAWSARSPSLEPGAEIAV